ncbi:hypothetical protein EV286_11950 [Rhizobium sp. BK251]|nr:hypothetical protein EV286_11950 [Rhizobium sp. BK251]
MDDREQNSVNVPTKFGKTRGIPTAGISTTGSMPRNSTKRRSKTLPQSQRQTRRIPSGLQGRMEGHGLWGTCSHLPRLPATRDGSG